MKTRLVLPLLLVAGLGMAQPPAVPVNKEPAGPVQGALLICGGGPMPDSVREKFVALAGGKGGKLVVIPTASASADTTPEKSMEPWKKYGFAGLSVLHTRDRKKADDAEFAKAIGDATAVWFGGGDQSRITDAYRGTKVEEELHKLLKRGGVIGGTSAGAAIHSGVMITGGNPDPKLGKGFGFIPGFIVDQHFLKRKRTDRLFSALAKHPGLAGVGVDEETGLLVQGRTLSVVGNSVAVICLPAGNGRMALQQTLKPGEKADLIALSRAAIARAEAPFPPPKMAAPVLAKGTLVIGGGGTLPDAVWERFIDAAGGKDAPIVVIPTALEDPVPAEPGDAKTLRKLGATKVSVLHTRSRAEANTDKFLAPLKEARGVWFTGGRQWCLVDAFKDTKAERALHDVLARGGVIGGTSAGTSIQSEYMVRGHPLGNETMSAEGYERGLGFLPGTAIDQHFFVRKRTADMAGLLERHPQLLGLGIDEATAAVVRGDMLEVVGKSRVAVYDGSRPLPDFVTLEPGKRYDLKARRVVERP